MNIPLEEFSLEIQEAILAGEEVILTRDGVPVVKLIPLKPKPAAPREGDSRPSPT